MTVAEIASLSEFIVVILILSVAVGFGAVIGWAGAKTSYDRKIFGERAAMKAEARNELLWEMQRTQQAPPADGPVYRA